MLLVTLLQAEAVGKGMETEGDMHTLRVEYYSALESKVILTHATTWVNLEVTVPGEAGLILHNSQKDPPLYTTTCVKYAWS